VVVVADEEDRIIFQKPLANNLNEILGVLASHMEETVGVVVESTYNWYWLVDGLMDVGYQVHLANPGRIKKYEGLKYSGDFTDAAYLVHLLRLGLLPEGLYLPAGTAGSTGSCTKTDAAGALPDDADSVH
jgi:hypothetical protein